MITIPTTKQTTLIEAALQVAKGQIGAMEKPLNSNSGPEVDQYLRSVGLKPGYAWCAAFVYWCFLKAATQLGITTPLVRTAGCMDHWNRAGRAGIRRITAQQARENPALVRPGMIGVLLIAPLTGAGHTYIVERTIGTRLMTIEGNSNENGSREGLGVYRLSRRSLGDKTLVGFIDYGA